MTSPARPARGDASAYPETAYYDGHPTHSIGGLTIREHFAALAMQGMLAYFGDDKQTHDVTARMAVHMADFLIAELAKVKP